METSLMRNEKLDIPRITFPGSASITGNPRERVVFSITVYKNSTEIFSKGLDSILTEQVTKTRKE